MSKKANRQIFQRAISGLFAAAGILAIILLTVQGQYAGWPQIVSGLLAIGGCYLFGYFALRGHLPGKHLQKASAAISHVTDRHDA